MCSSTLAAVNPPDGARLTSMCQPSASLGLSPRSRAVCLEPDERRVMGDECRRVKRITQNRAADLSDIFERVYDELRVLSDLD